MREGRHTDADKAAARSTVAALRTVITDDYVCCVIVTNRKTKTMITCSNTNLATEEHIIKVAAGAVAIYSYEFHEPN